MNLKTWSRHFWLLPAFCIIFGILPNIVSSETRLVCYYADWSVYRPGSAQFTPDDIDPNLCTHLIFAFGNLTQENTLAPFDTYYDIERGHLAKFTALKTSNKNLKTIFGIGGWEAGSSNFSLVAADPNRRREMVKNSIKFLRQNHFDGLDVDWEYPSFRGGGKARDRENYATLIQELREEFDRESEKTGQPRLSLTMTISAVTQYIDKCYDIPKLTKYVDWMNVLSYNYYNTFDPKVNHHSPLYPNPIDENDTLNINYTIQYYLNAGADIKKLVLGIPLYGKSYTLLDKYDNELGAQADGSGDKGRTTKDVGALAYYEICENIKERNWTVRQPNPDVMGPYAFKENQWVSFDDELIIKKKTKYVIDNGLGGVMFWTIDFDDFRGNCFNKPYPLIEAAKEVLQTAVPRKTDDNLVSSQEKARESESVTLTQLTSVGENSGSEETRPREETPGSRRQPTTSAPVTTRTTSTTEELENDEEDKYKNRRMGVISSDSTNFETVGRSFVGPDSQNQDIERQEAEIESRRGWYGYRKIHRNLDEGKKSFVISINIDI